MSVLTVTLSRHRWTKSEDFAGGYYAPPSGAVSTIDLRNLEQQSTTGIETDASCLCLMAPDAKIDDSHDVIASGDPRDVLVDGAILDLFVARLGLKSAPSGDTLADCIADLLLTHADPKGLDFCKPLMPTVQRQLELWLGGKAFARPFIYGTDALTNKVQAVYQDDFRAVFEAVQAGAVPPDLHLKVLDYWAEKLRIDKSDRSALDALIPVDLRADVPAMLVPHETTLTDNFNRANESPLAAPWSHLVSQHNLSGNKANGSAPGANLSRYDSDLSSADHYCQYDAVSGVATGHGTGPVARKDSSSTQTFYMAWFGSSTAFQLYKCVAGTVTQLGSDYAYTYSAPDTAKVECNGTSIAAYLNDTSVIAVTDSAISGNLRCGIRSFQADVIGDNWSAADLAASGGPFPHFLRRARSMSGGMIVMGM